MQRFIFLVLTLVMTGGNTLENSKSPIRPNRITGGAIARAREFPYTVSIRTSDYDDLGHFCGGAIISPNLILTAGACTDPLSPNITSIVAGSLNRAKPYPGEQSRKVAKSVPHPGYVFPPYDDISLIFLDQPFNFTENISAIALPRTNQTTYPNPVVVNGWGSVQYGQPMADVLYRTTMDTYSDSYCAEFMNEIVPDNLLCAGTDEGGVGACFADAGAPLTTTTGEIYIAGVMSHFGCTDPECCGFPGPMDHSPEVAYYLDWIQETSDLYGGGL